MEARPPRTRVIQGLFSELVVIVPYTEEQAEEGFKNGGVPLDQVPISYWWQGEYPRFGEEVLGDEF